MNAAQPHTAHAVVLAAQSVVSIGQAGAWIGPLLVGALAAALDASAIGAHAWRDRIRRSGPVQVACRRPWPSKARTTRR